MGIAAEGVRAEEKPQDPLRVSVWSRSLSAPPVVIFVHAYKSVVTKLGRNNSKEAGSGWLLACGMGRQALRQPCDSRSLLSAFP